jgi:hypothetical protein
MKQSGKRCSAAAMGCGGREFSTKNTKVTEKKIQENLRKFRRFFKVMPLQLLPPRVFRLVSLWASYGKIRLTAGFEWKLLYAR